MAVKDYNQLLVQLWADAADSPGGKVLDFTTADKGRGLGTAITQRHVMYRLRKEMEREGHPFAKKALRCKISTRITLKDGRALFFSKSVQWTDAEVAKIELLIIPKNDDKVMEAALEKAGYQTPKAPSFD